ncbi:MAG: complex I NDUFA9 subunit family protein [Thermoleophilia bacterium]
MRVLVSGVTGFMGSAIARQLLDAGHEVRGLTRNAQRARRKFSEVQQAPDALATGKLTFVEGDVTEPDTLRPAVESMDVVVQAAQFSGAPVEDPARGLTYMNVDRNGTLNLLDAIASAYGAQTAGPGMYRFPGDAPRFLYLSGVTVNRDSPHRWDQAKWQAEEAIRGSGLDWTILRSSPAYGPEDRSFNRLIGYSDYLPFVPLFGDGEEKLTPVYVEDVGRIFARLVEDREAARSLTLPFGGPQVVTMNEMIRTMLEIMGRRRFLLHIPKPVGKIQGLVLQLLPGQILSADAVDFAAQGGAADLSLLRERFPGFSPTPLREGLSRYL